MSSRPEKDLGHCSSNVVASTVFGAKYIWGTLTDHALPPENYEIWLSSQAKSLGTKVKGKSCRSG